MSVINIGNTPLSANSSANVELVSDKENQATRNNRNIEKVERSTLTEKIIAAEELNKAQEKEAKKVDSMTPGQLEKMAQQLQAFMGEMNRSLEFLVDKDSGRDVIKVLDKGTGELVKQYPSEEVLTMISKLSDATGNLIDTEI